MNTTKVLVTGATGFLGKNVCERLLGDKTVDLRMTSLHGDKKASVEALDLMDLPAISEFIREMKPDVVYHLGGLVDLTRDYEVAVRCIRTNLVGTANLLEGLKGSSV